MASPTAGTDGKDEKTMAFLGMYNIGNNEENEKPMVLLGMYNLGYNLTHTLKTVIVKNIAVEDIADECITGWMKKAQTYKIGKSENNKCDLVLRFNTVNLGNQACIDLKENIDDGQTEVLHPNFEYWGAHPCLYWEMLSKITSVKHAPLKKDELESVTRHRHDRFRHCAVENVPKNLIDEDLSDIFKEATDIIVFNYETATSGVVLVEFDSEEKAVEYSKATKSVTILEQDCPVSYFPERLDQWQESGVAEKVQERRKQLPALSDEERIDLLKEHKSCHEQKKQLVDDITLTGQQKLEQFFHLNQQQGPIKWSIHHDTQRRREQDISLPEPPELKFIKNYPTITNKEAKKRRKAARDGAQKDKLHVKKFFLFDGEGKKDAKKAKAEEKGQTKPKAANKPKESGPISKKPKLNVPFNKPYSQKRFPVERNFVRSANYNVGPHGDETAFQMSRMVETISEAISEKIVNTMNATVFKGKPKFPEEEMGPMNSQRYGAGPKFYGEERPIISPRHVRMNAKFPEEEIGPMNSHMYGAGPKFYGEERPIIHPRHGGMNDSQMYGAGPKFYGEERPIMNRRRVGMTMPNTANYPMHGNTRNEMRPPNVYPKSQFNKPQTSDQRLDAFRAGLI